MTLNRNIINQPLQYPHRALSKKGDSSQVKKAASLIFSPPQMTLYSAFFLSQRYPLLRIPCAVAVIVTVTDDDDDEVVVVELLDEEEEDIEVLEDVGEDVEEEEDVDVEVLDEVELVEEVVLLMVLDVMRCWEADLKE
ncbi:MAG: hypothetical protein Q9213_004678 [Squamulea squamosa]